MENCLKNSSELRVARTIPAQPATRREKSATSNATRAQPISLKALARQTLERNRQRNQSATQVKKQRNLRLQKTPKSCASIFDTESAKIHEIAIKKMSICLHGKPCKNISLVDFRQICLKNNQPIFDMAVCPDGRYWERSQDRPQKKTMTCYCCGGQTFWRKKDNRGGRWICEVCHPPMPIRDGIEFFTIEGGSKRHGII